MVYHSAVSATTQINANLCSFSSSQLFEKYFPYLFIMLPYFLPLALTFFLLIKGISEIKFAVFETQFLTKHTFFVHNHSTIGPNRPFQRIQSLLNLSHSHSLILAISKFEIRNKARTSYIFLRFWVFRLTQLHWNLNKPYL